MIERLQERVHVTRRSLILQTDQPCLFARVVFAIKRTLHRSIDFVLLNRRHVHSEIHTAFGVDVALFKNVVARDERREPPIRFAPVERVRRFLRFHHRRIRRMKQLQFELRVPSPLSTHVVLDSARLCRPRVQEQAHLRRRLRFRVQITPERIHRQPKECISALKRLTHHLRVSFLPSRELGAPRERRRLRRRERQLAIFRTARHRSIVVFRVRRVAVVGI